MGRTDYSYRELTKRKIKVLDGSFIPPVGFSVEALAWLEYNKVFASQLVFTGDSTVASLDAQIVRSALEACLQLGGSTMGLQGKWKESEHELLIREEKQRQERQQQEKLLRKETGVRRYVEGIDNPGFSQLQTSSEHAFLQVQAVLSASPQSKDAPPPALRLLSRAFVPARSIVAVGMGIISSIDSHALIVTVPPAMVLLILITLAGAEARLHL